MPKFQVTWIISFLSWLYHFQAPWSSRLEVTVVYYSRLLFVNPTEV